MRRRFLNFSHAWSKRKINVKIVLASMKTFTNFKDWSESRSKIYVPASLIVIGRFSTVYAGKIRVNLHVLAASGL